MRTSSRFYAMLTMRRAASSASGIASGFRTQIPRARVARSSITLTRLPQTVSLSWRGARSFASETDKPLSESASEVASEAANSLKGTAEATEQFSSEAAASAGETLNKGYDQAQATASSTAEQISSQAEGVASAVSSSEPASTAQSTPLHAEGVNTPPQEVQKSTLYVGNLYFEVTEKALGDEFGRFGEVIGTKIVYDGRGLSKGFGYVEFASAEDASKAKEALNQQIFEGRRLAVQQAVARKPRPPMGSSGADQGFKHPPSRTLYIGNMSYEMSDKDLNDLFRQIKNVLDVRVAIDRRTGQPRGYAHADFLDIESAEKAAEHLKTLSFYGRHLRVDYTHSRQAQSPRNSEPSQ